MRSEIELLLACARRTMSDADLARARAVMARGVDWPRVIDDAQWHKLVPLLHWHVDAIDAPPTARRRLAELARQHALRCLMVGGELLRLLGLYKEAGVFVVPLKGLALAQQVYGSVSFRQAGDIDLLFQPEDVERAVSLLRSCGYSFKAEQRGLEHEQLARRGSHHIVATHPQRRLSVELHYGLLPPRGRRDHGMEVIAGLLVPMNFIGHTISVLPPEEQFAYLCQHGAAHAWSRLEWLATAAELLRSGAVKDWSRVIQFASCLGGSRRVAAAIELMDVLLGRMSYPGAPPSDWFTATANRRAIQALDQSSVGRIHSAWDYFAYQLLVDSSVTERFHRIWTTFAQPTDDDLGAAITWVPLQRLMRPFGMLSRQLRRMRSPGGRH